MEFLRKLLQQTQTYLKGMALSQRLAIGSCAALIVLSLMWLVNWAGTAELVPLLDQPLSTQEIAPIQQRLDMMQVKYRVTGDVIFVPAESRARLLAQLGEQKALPKDISIGFAKLMDDSSPWVNMEEQGWRRSVALGNELSRVLREFDGVLDARVFIDKNMRRTIGAAPVTPTASVFVKLAPGMGLEKERVFAMASFVSSTVAGMDISNVAVTDATTGRSFKVPTAAEGMAFDDLEDRQKKEEYFANKIKSLLANIPGLLVAVHAELDSEARKETKLVHGKPPMISEKTETTTTERGITGGGPGVVPNTSRSVATATPTERTEKSSTEAEYDGKVDVTQTMTEAPRHGIRSLSASVNVPRGYLAAIYRQGHEGKEPTDAELQTASVGEIDKIKRQVKRALAVPDDSDTVAVDWFHDDAVARFGPAVVEASASGEFMDYVKTYGGKVGIGALAVVSIFMMLMMVRRVGEGPVLPGEEPPVPLRRGDRRRTKGQEDEDVELEARGPVGRAQVTEQLLVAKEVDEQTIRTQQVVEQVAGMIRDDPESSVSILQQWIDKARS